jgi:GNAT superfamily N-acetyltransferase
MNPEIKLLDYGNEIQVLGCYQAFKHLRPHLDHQDFKERIQVQSKEGYCIPYIEESNNVVAAAGYRIANFLAWGKVFYIDDLITLPEKKKAGHGGALMDWMVAKAKNLGCDELHLDTGFQRHDAHRLYLRKGLQLSCHHLSIKLRP